MRKRWAGTPAALWVCALAACAAGCTAVGYSVGADLTDKGDRGWGMPIEVTDARLIAHGTPVQVGLSDSGFVRGVFLGVSEPDSASGPTAGPALRLGVGNRIQLDQMFSSGKALTNPTREQVPDTLRFLLAGMRELRVPGTAKGGAAAGAAVGFSIDATIVVLVVASGALLVWLFSRGQ